MSPAKTELAPARKQRAWSDSVMWTRPAERRTIDRGIRMRAVAIVRTMSQISTRG